MNITVHHVNDPVKGQWYESYALGGWGEEGCCQAPGTCGCRGVVGDELWGVGWVGGGDDAKGGENIEDTTVCGGLWVWGKALRRV